MTFKHTEERLARPWFARATWIGRAARGSIFVLPPVLTLAFGVFAARHEAAVGIRDVTAFARSASIAGGEAAEAVERARESRAEADRLREQSSMARLRAYARRDPDFRAAVAADNQCVRDSDCMKNEGMVRVAYPRRRQEELRKLVGGAPFDFVTWHPPCGRRKEPFPVCRKNACTLEERTVVHPPCRARPEDPLAP